jgi:hypothetical protein
VVLNPVETEVLRVLKPVDKLDALVDVDTLRLLRFVDKPDTAVDVDVLKLLIAVDKLLGAALSAETAVLKLLT